MEVFPPEALTAICPNKPLLDPRLRLLVSADRAHASPPPASLAVRLHMARHARAKGPLMSKSSSSRSSRSSTTKPTRAARGRSAGKPAAPAAVAARAPWIEDGIDFGPARAAVDDLVNWALDLAELEVDGDRADLKRIRKVRRAFLSDVASNVAVSDLIFVAQILARVFDRDLGLGLADQLAIFDKLDLDTDLLPLSPMPRRPTPLGAVIPTRMPTPGPVERRPTPTVRIQFATPASLRVAPSARSHTAPPPLRFCDDCGYVHEPGDHVFQRRNAA